MLKVDSKDSKRKIQSHNESKEVTDLLIGTKITKSLSDCVKDVVIDKMVHKDHYQKLLLKNKVTQDLRTQSLPNCLVEKNKSEENIDTTDSCDTHNKLLTEISPPHSPCFRTWPKRCDKIKNNENCLNSPQDTQENLKKCDIDNGVKNKLTLNEALQNISLAYSPVTKQLHLVEKCSDKVDITVSSLSDQAEENSICNTEIKKGHRRNPAGSFSSTISSLSEPSTSKSLLDGDEKSLGSFDDEGDNNHKKSLTSFFTRNVFSSWRSNSNVGSSVWKLFSKSDKNICGSGSPHHVASSSALIQHQRPSNLPAKTQEEEERHREQYKAIIAAAKKKEAQNTLARQKHLKLQLQQEEHQATVAKHFLKQVLPNWDQMHTTKKTRDLWWQGLPSCIRGRVWRLAIGNDLNLTPQLYEICLCRAQARLSSPSPSQCELDLDQESSMDVIRLDISRTFPHLGIFQEGGPYSEVLHSMLAAYVCYRPDVGYVQGMSYIAAILILNMEASDAFICFANLLNQPLHLSAFTLNQVQMQAYYDAYNEVLCYNLPRLYQHFEEANLTPDLYLLDWIYTVFAKAMPLDVACRVWDMFLRDGCEFIFKTALGILHLNQDTLIGMDFLHGAQFLTRLPDDLSADQLFKSIQSITTNIGKQTFNQVVDKYSASLR